MVKLGSDNGYTLIELIIVIGLLAIAIGLSGFGLNVIFSSNVNSYATQIVNELKLVQTKELASSKNDYIIEIKYDDLQKMYEVSTRMNGDEIHSIKLPSNMVINYKQNDTDAYGLITNATSKTFMFNETSGKLTTSAAGFYQISSTTSSKVKTFQVIGQNGRVVEID